MSFRLKSWIAGRLLDRFEQRYDYDVAYMREMLRVAPRALDKFSKLTPASAHREVTPPEAFYAVKLVAALSADCGPCTQLAADMAAEGGVADAQIAAVLAGDRESMSSEAATGYRFAAALAFAPEHLESARDEVRRRWGAAGVVELSMCFAVGRVFPTLKTAMGFGDACRVVRVAERPVKVLAHAV